MPVLVDLIKDLPPDEFENVADFVVVIIQCVIIRVLGASHF